MMESENQVSHKTLKSSKSKTRQFRKKHDQVIPLQESSGGVYVLLLDIFSKTVNRISELKCTDM